MRDADSQTGELMGVKVTDYSSLFVSKSDQAIDAAMGAMAQDIEILAKKKVPVSNTKASGNKRGGGGHLQSSIKGMRVAPKHFQVVADKEYARFQEFGGDGKRVVRHYSTPGTGAHYMRNAGMAVKKNFEEYVKGRVKLIYMPKSKG